MQSDTHALSGIESTTPTFEWKKAVHALDRKTTETGERFTQRSTNMTFKYMYTWLHLNSVLLPGTLRSLLTVPER
jgi:hypothetical protein